MPGPELQHDVHSRLEIRWRPSELIEGIHRPDCKSFAGSGQVSCGFHPEEPDSDRVVMSPIILRAKANTVNWKLEANLDQVE